MRKTSVFEDTWVSVLSENDSKKQSDSAIAWKEETPLERKIYIGEVGQLF